MAMNVPGGLGGGGRAVNPRGGRARSFAIGELLGFLTGGGTSLLAVSFASVMRRAFAGAFTGLTGIDAAATADNAAIESVRTQVRDRIRALDLPEQLKNRAMNLTDQRIDQAANLLGDGRITDDLRQARIANLRTELNHELEGILVQYREMSFQVRIFESLAQGVRNRLNRIDGAFNDAQRQRWLRDRENVESPTVIVSALQAADQIITAATGGTPDEIAAARTAACERFLVILEDMTAKPLPPPKLSPEQWIGKLAKDNPMVGKVIQSGAVLLGLTPDPVPLMQRGQSEVQYRAQLQPLNLSPKDLEARVRSEMQRVRLEASSEAREQGNRSFANSLNSPDAPRFPPMSTSETRDAYSRRMNDFFRSATAREAHVNRECLRVVRLPPLSMRDNEDWINYKARITPYLSNAAELDAHVRSEWIRMKNPEDRAGYTARITPYFTDPAALAAWVNAECTRLGKP